MGVISVIHYGSGISTRIASLGISAWSFRGQLGPVAANEVEIVPECDESTTDKIMLPPSLGPIRRLLPAGDHGWNP